MLFRSVAFNNAGVNIPGVFHEVPDEIVDRTLDVNVKGCIYGCRYAIPHMLRGGGGSLINTTSVNGLVAEPFLAIYATSKAAVVHYTRCLAEQMRPYEVTVNSIAPGDTRTGRFVGTRPVDPRRMATAGTLDRIATVDEVARTLEFFVGPMGAFVTGQAMRVDGGTQLWPG